MNLAKEKDTNIQERAYCKGLFHSDGSISSRHDGDLRREISDKEETLHVQGEKEIQRVKGSSHWACE